MTATRIYIILTMWLLIGGSVRLTHAQTKIRESGNTVVTAVGSNGKASVTIKTVKLEGNCAMACPTSKIWADYGAKETMVVQTMDISVRGKSLPVPFTVYATLFAPQEASLQFSKGHFILKIDGADGSESYFVEVYFDASGVNEVKRYSSLIPDKPSEDTRYYHNVFKYQ